MWFCSCSVLDRRGILQQEESTAQEESCPRGPTAQEPPAGKGPGGQAEESSTQQKDGSLPHPSTVSDSPWGRAEWAVPAWSYWCFGPAARKLIV